jgi:hypothetical protein
MMTRSSQALNPVINPANIDRGANHLAEGQIVESLTTREKIRLSADEWRVIRAAVEHGRRYHQIPARIHSWGITRP